MTQRESEPRVTNESTTSTVWSDGLVRINTGPARGMMFFMDQSSKVVGQQLPDAPDIDPQTSSTEQQSGEVAQQEAIGSFGAAMPIDFGERLRAAQRKEFLVEINTLTSDDFITPISIESNNNT